MSRYRLFYFKFEDGSEKMLKADEAQAYADQKGLKISFDSTKRPQFKKMVKDGFQPGRCYGTGQYFGGPREKAKWLSRNKMEEMGKERPKFAPPETKPFDPKTMEEIIRNTGAEIGGVMADKLIKDGPIEFHEAPEDLERPQERGGFYEEYDKIN